MKLTQSRLFAIFLAITVVACAIFAGSGCSGSTEPPGVTGDPGKARADMIKWHQEHDKVPQRAAAPGSSN